MMNREDKQSRIILNDRRTKRRSKIQTVLLAVGCLAVMVAVMYATVSICFLIDDKRQGDALEASAVSKLNDKYGFTVDEDGNILDETGNAVSFYTEAELALLLEEARNKAGESGAAVGENAVLDKLREGLTSEDASIIQTVRSLFPDELIISSGGEYHFVPINHNLKLNQWKQENLNVLESGEFQYLENGQVTSYKGIDVSKHQGDIDWEKVAEDGVKFAFIRVGYRGYGSAGRMMEDEYFEQNVKGAAQAGIKVGVYFYSQATTEEEAREEAKFVLDRIAPYKIECPVVFDVELVSGADGRMDNLSVEQRTNVTKVFCEAIKEAGYTPMIYYNMEMGIMFLDLAQLEGYDKWFAAYTDKLYYPYEYKALQYSQSGTVSGIRGDVDLNISFEPLWEE